MTVRENQQKADENDVVEMRILAMFSSSSLDKVTGQSSVFSDKMFLFVRKCCFGKNQFRQGRGKADILWKL